MTRDEAIKLINHKIDLACDDAQIMSDVEYEALQMCVKALEQEPCNDVISREDALQALCRAVHKNDDNIPCINQRVSCLWNKTKVQDYAEEILKLPSVTPQPKIGHWVTNSDFPDRLICSGCNTKFDMWVWEQKNMHYCPNCGIKMQEVEVKE